MRLAATHTNAHFALEYFLLFSTGQDDAQGRRHLVLPRQELPHQVRRWRLEPQHDRRRLGPVGHQEAQGDEGALDIETHHDSPFDTKRCSILLWNKTLRFSPIFLPRISVSVQAFGLSVSAGHVAATVSLSNFACLG